MATIGDMKVMMLRREDGSAYGFQFGAEGTPFEYEPNDADSAVIAFTKAVNEGVEKGEEIEGGPAIAVAQILKEASGTVVWDDDSFNDLRADVQEALPNLGNNVYVYVEDISITGSKALICVSGDGVAEGGGYGSEYYVAAFTVNAGDDVVVDPRANWIAVERDDRFVAKAGRVFSGKHLNAMQTVHDALGLLIEAGAPKNAPVETEEEDALKSDGPSLSYTVQKADSQMRYTLGPLYAPLREDAHGEWIEDEALHKSLHEFVRQSSDDGRRINLQHGDKGDITVGEWVETMRWPYEHTIKVRNAAGEEHDVEMPAGTVYLGVIWDEEYWDTEKSAPKGLDGYSLGGRAMKVKGTSESLKSMGYKVTKSTGEPVPVVPPVADPKEIDLAIEVGRTEGERRVYKEVNERLLEVLTEGAKTGVTINENGTAGLEALLETSTE